MIYSMKDVLINAKQLIEKTGWAQGEYAIKDGKTFYDFLSSGELADKYSLTGALTKIRYDLAKLNKKLSLRYNIMTHEVQQLILKLEDFNGCLADWEDQNPEQDLLNDFIKELRSKNTSREQAKIEINNFKKELKNKNVKPIITIEKIFSTLNKAIDVCNKGYLTIKAAKHYDCDELYEIGLSMPELRVNNNIFMSKDEFAQSIISPTSVFLCAFFNGIPIGFIYADSNDLEKKGYEERTACLVYIAVHPDYRNIGIGSKLFDACIEKLRECGITNIYSWCSLSGSIISFMENKGLIAGNQYLWMDRRI